LEAAEAAWQQMQLGSSISSMAAAADAEAYGRCIRNNDMPAKDEQKAL